MIIIPILTGVGLQIPTVYYSHLQVHSQNISQVLTTICLETSSAGQGGVQSLCAKSVLSSKCISEKKVVVGLTQFRSPDLEPYFRKGKVGNTLGFHYKCYLGHY